MKGSLNFGPSIIVLWSAVTSGGKIAEQSTWPHFEGRSLYFHMGKLRFVIKNECRKEYLAGILAATLVSGAQEDIRNKLVSSSVQEH